MKKPPFHAYVERAAPSEPDARDKYELGYFGLLGI